VSRIAITSQPAGAEVWIGDEPAARGQTPLTIEVAAGGTARAVLKAAGHEPVTLVLDAKDPGARHVVLPATPAAAAPPPAAPATKPHKHHEHAKAGGDFKAIED
jgi:hypothetical protein